MSVQLKLDPDQHPETGRLGRQARRLRGAWQRRINPVPDAELQTQAALAGEFRSKFTVDGMRLLFDSVSRLLNGRLPPLGQQITGISLGEHTPATVDLQIPSGSGPHPVLVYLHGGAWVAGSPASHRKLTARIAESGFVVVSVDYRLAPENPFPAGLEDCIDAVYWAAANAGDYGGDPARLAIGGDSAGANLAAAAAGVLASRLTAPRLSAAVLIYGVFDMHDMGDDGANRFIHQAYLPGESIDLLNDPRVSPIHCAQALPPCFVTVGTQDSLLEQNREFRDALIAAGRPCVYVEERSMPHGFMQMEFMGAARDVVRQIADFLDEHLVETKSTRLRGAFMRVSRQIWRSFESWIRRRALRGSSRWRIRR